MPELVDVEGFRRVARHAVGRDIGTVRVFDPQVLRGTTERTLRSRLRGRRFDEPRRHGKWLVLPVADTSVAVLMHFGMTGSLHWVDDGSEPHRHDRVQFELTGGMLRYRDMRKLTGLRLATDRRSLDAVLGELGPDAAAVNRAEFAEVLGGGRRGLKSTLMDQEVLAGLGNLLVDEILWRAGIHPRRYTANLDDADIGRLHARMRRVLRDGSRAGRVPDRPSWLTGTATSRKAAARAATPASSTVVSAAARPSGVRTVSRGERGQWSAEPSARLR